jgi:ribosome-binding protein aMBF1 (putative translation factor)
MNEHKPLHQTQDTVTLRLADYEALLEALEDAEDRAAMLEHTLAKAKGSVPEPLTMDEADRLRAGEHPVRVWRQKRGLTQQGLASAVGISKSFLSEIESSSNTPSVDTLRKLAHELKVDLDTLAP